MDTNTPQSDAPLEQLLTDCQLIDPLSQMHDTPTATHTEGNRLDRIFITDILLPLIRRTGVISSDLGADSDHAAIFLDLDNHIFSKNPNPTAPSMRGFTSRQRIEFEKHGQSVDDHLSTNTNLHSLQLQLPCATSTRERSIICDQIDQIVTTRMCKEENRLARQPNHIAWSPIYTKHRKSYSTARRQLRKFRKTGLTSSDYPADSTTNSATVLHYLSTKVKTTLTALRKIESDADTYRFNFLLQKIKEATADNHSTLLRRFQRIYQSEIRRLTFKKITPIVKGTQISNLDRVVVPDTNGTKEITDQRELLQALIHRNQNHFNQAAETPFANPPLSDVLPPLQSDHDLNKRLLDGNITDFSHHSHIIISLLSSLETLPTLTPVDPILTTADFTAGMAAAKEGKTSSLSGRHYSVYKALMTFPYTSNLIVTLINECTEHSFLLTRWKKALQVMICKVPGNYNIEKLRVTQLLEADLNMYLRLIWGKRLVKNTTKHNLFPPEQLGNKPGVLGASAALLKVLIFDHIRLQRSDATIFNNDAKACYDRIIPGLSQLCCQSLGLPQKTADFMLHFLKLAEHHVKTNSATSETYYNNLQKAMHGVLQGSGSAPAIWLAVSTILVRTYNRQFQDDGIHNPTNTQFIKKLLDAFVDDTDLWDIINDSTLTTQEMVTRMQTRPAQLTIGFSIELQESNVAASHHCLLLLFSFSEHLQKIGSHVLTKGLNTITTLIFQRSVVDTTHSI